MDDISSILSNLSDEDINSLRQAAASLMSQGTAAKENKETPVPALSDAPFSDIDIGLVNKISKAMKQLNEKDEKFELIRALRPHLSPELQKRADEALRFLKLISIIPMLK